MKRIVMAFLISLLAVLTQSAPIAMAHSQVVSQSPAPDAEITSLPTKIEISFNEKLISLGDGNQLHLLDPEGLEVTIGELTTSERTISRELNVSTKLGEYYVAYRAVSADGHVVAGEYTFNLTAAVAPLIASAPQTNTDDGAESGPNLLVSLVIFLLVLLAGILIWRFRAKK
jgi:methionine-rich copper-binding protein CopC